MPAITLAALLCLNWWASWYPGSEPGGGGYVVQNMLACRTEREARSAALFFNIAHYALRSWPWVITALCTLVMYGGAVHDADPGVNYVRAMVDLLPSGLRGLMLASFVAAFSSTQATQMNWGSSYLVNDLYRRFIKRDATEKHYVLAARLATALTLVLSLIATQFMDQISHAWQFLLMLGAGTGLVYILRWYWWRINAWSEVSAMAAALVVSLTLRNFTRRRLAARIRDQPDHHHAVDDGGLAGRDAADRARTARHARCASTEKCVPPDRDGASSPARAASSRSAASSPATPSPGSSASSSSTRSCSPPAPRSSTTRGSS